MTHSFFRSGIYRSSLVGVVVQLTVAMWLYVKPNKSNFVFIRGTVLWLQLYTVRPLLNIKT